MAENNKNSASKTWWQPALVMFAKFSGWIFIPLLFGLYLGKWLDKKYGTEPWLFLTSVGMAFAISIVGLIISVLKDFKRIEKEAQQKK